jgi:hypothetical protein
MDLYYMSSSNVVFVCDAGRMFHTQNKLLVPEWPTFIDVYSFTVTYNTMKSEIPVSVPIRSPEYEKLTITAA